jgi:chromate reductase
MARRSLTPKGAKLSLSAMGASLLSFFLRRVTNKPTKQLMTAKRDVVVLVGSLRKGSFTRMVAKALVSLAPERLAFELVEIRDLPLYDFDLEAAPPASWTAFRERVARADAVLFTTPEYNRSVPGALKNAVDVGSRPPPASVWRGKPAGVVSVSPGAIGAMGANHHLRQSLVSVDMATMAGPEAYIGGAAKLFDEAGVLTNESTKEFLTKFMVAFDRWVDLFKRS